MEENPYCNNCQRHISSANFASHSAFCERNIKVCKICNEPIPISEEKEHLEEFHITVPCDLCGILFEKWTLPRHKELCSKRLVTCIYCEGEVPFEEFSDHFEFCSSRTEKCTLCKKYIMLKDKEKHSEIHLCERKIRHVNIDKETRQNIINEVISNSTLPEQDIEEKVIATKIFSSRTVVNKNETFPQSIVSNERSTSDSNKSKEVDETRNSSIISDNILTSEDETHLNSRVPTGSNAHALHLPNEMSKRYGTCYICNQTDPWIDMNTHIPNCASDAGKCSRCGEDVPNHEFKEHVLKNCKGLLKEGSANKSDLKRDKISRDATFHVEKDIDNQDMQQCPYCKQACSLDRIIAHMKSCSERFYKCPYCNLQILKEDKGKHEAFECSVLLEIQGHDPLYVHSSSDASRNSPEKYKYTTKINLTSKSKAMKEKSSIDKSYADSSRKVSFQDKNVSKCESCCPCHKKPACKRQEHSYTYQKSQKGTCFYCFEEIDASKEDIHLSTCEKFQKSNKSKAENQTSHKGAIPKRSNFADIVSPQMVNCKFCKNSYNADIVLYHEKECINQPFTCEECDDTFSLKDLEDHRCKEKRGRGKQRKQEVQVKTEFGIGKIRNFLFKSGNIGESDSDRFHSTYPLDTFDDKIPCEFCEKLFPASQIVMHETGCAPDLVGLPRKDSCEEVESKETKRTSFQEDRVSQKPFFPSETKSDLLYSRSGGKKKYMDANVKPGEFLESSYHDIETSESSKGQNIRPLVYSSNSSIHAVWNISSSDIKARDSGILSHTSILDKEKESETSSDPQKQLEDEEIFNSDDEMTEMLEFINDAETNTADKETFHSKYEELHRKYSKEKASHITSDHNLNSQGLHEDLSEIEKFLQLAEPTTRSSLEKNPAEFESDTDFNLKRLKHHHLPNIVTENRAFMIEPVEKHCLEHISARKIGEGIEHSARDNQDINLQQTSPESESDASSEVDLEKWTKWRSKESSSNR